MVRYAFETKAMYIESLGHYAIMASCQSPVEWLHQMSETQERCYSNVQWHRIRSNYSSGLISHSNKPFDRFRIEVPSRRWPISHSVHLHEIGDLRRFQQLVKVLSEHNVFCFYESPTGFRQLASSAKSAYGWSFDSYDGVDATWLDGTHKFHVPSRKLNESLPKAPHFLGRVEKVYG